MRERPVGDLLDALRLQEFTTIEFLEKPDCLPIKVTSKGFEGGEIYINSKKSSQFVSSILMAAPYAMKPVRLVLADIAENDEIVSETFIDMTIQTMRMFGISVIKSSYNTYEIPTGTYTSPKVIEIEPDSSTASYDLALVTLCGGTVKIQGLGNNSVQGDAQFGKTLEKIGCTVQYTEDSITLSRDLRVNCLKPIDINMNSQTDVFITLAVILSQVEGVSRITGIKNQRVKECDRIHAVIENLMQLSVFCKELDDGLEIHGRNCVAIRNVLKRQQNVIIKTYGDHRIAMAFTILGHYLSINSSNLNLVIDDRLCVSKTFPGFWNHIQKTHGIKFEPFRITTEKENAHGEFRILSEKTLFLIGMKGAGKSTLARAAANDLGLAYYDLVS
jgi:pentafunctional AROM polypeptide